MFAKNFLFLSESDAWDDDEDDEKNQIIFLIDWFERETGVLFYTFRDVGHILHEMDRSIDIVQIFYAHVC